MQRRSGLPLAGASRPAERLAPLLRRGATIAIALLAHAAGVGAGTITLDTATECGAIDEGALCQVQLRNRGTDPALEVTVHANLAGRRASAAALPRLEVAHSATSTLELDTRDLAAGRHPVAVQIDYQDPNGYPLTALGFSYLDLELPTAPEPPLFGAIAPIEVTGSGTLRVALRNLTDETLAAELELVLPRELTAEPSRVDVELGAGAEHTESFRVRNFSALAGSSYSVLAIARGQHRGGAFGLVIPAQVSVTAGRSGIGRFRTPALVALIVLAALFLVAQLRPRLPSGPRPGG